MEKYSSYKDSGVQWLGEIPSHWEVKKIRHILSLANEKAKEPGSELLSLSQYVGVTKKTDSNVGIRAAEDTTGYNIVHKGQFVMNIMLAWNGSYAVSNYDGIISPAYCVFDFTRECDKRYYNYLLRIKVYAGAFKTESKGIIDSRLRLYPQYFKNFPLIVPPLEEQQSMATYLDKATAEIDKAIAQQQHMIDLLNERKQIIIQRAVTKGLDKNVEVKDSGVDWIGEIPAHWSIMKLRSIGSTINGVSHDSTYFGSGCPFVSYSDVYKNPSLPNEVSGLAKSSNSEKAMFSVEEGDVFFTRTSETAEEIGFSSVCMSTIEKAVFAGFLIRFRPNKGILHKNYSKYYFRSKMLRNYFVKEMNLVTRASLSQGLLKGLPIIVPSMQEQENISLYLDKVTGKIDKAIERHQQMLILLQERKQIIISEVVTGKIKVS